MKRESRERKTLQPWVLGSFKDRPGWVAWKVEDAYRPGLPDVIVKAPTGRVSWLELKWSTAMGVISFELSREQWVHLRQWGEGAFVLVAAPLVETILLIPIEALDGRQQSLTSDAVRRLPGAQWCRCDKTKLGAFLRDRLT